MRGKALVIVCLVIPIVLVVSGFRYDTHVQMDRKQLRAALVHLGYTVSDIDKTAGSERYAITVERGGFRMPVVLDIRDDDKVVWLAVPLVPSRPDNAAYNDNLLKKNADIQPYQFYITTAGKVMIGVPIDNNRITYPLLSERLDGLTDKVLTTRDDWGSIAN